jgi:hypothetical protein
MLDGRRRKLTCATVISSIAAAVALAVAASPAAAAYYPFGPRAFVDKSRLVGWELCFSGLYDGEVSLGDVLAQCDGDPLLLAGGPTGSPTLTVLAAAPRADVIFDTGTSNDPTTPTAAVGTSAPAIPGGSPSRATRYSAIRATPRQPRIRTCASAGTRSTASSPEAGARARQSTSASARTTPATSTKLPPPCRPASSRAGRRSRPASRRRIASASPIPASSPRAVSASV